MKTDHLYQAVNRRDLLRGALAASAVSPLALRRRDVLAQASPTAAPEELTIGYYDWLQAFFRSPLDRFNADFAALPIAARTLDSAGGPTLYLMEAEDQRSSYDFLLGPTPFVEMQALVDAGAIEPWDPYLPAGLLDDLPAAIRAEGSIDGKLYSWPFVFEPVCQGWNPEIVEKAGLDPAHAPVDWDEYIANATTVQQSGAAPYGCSYDLLPWRSLIPIAHSFSSDVYEPDGTFAWTSDAAVAALEVMRRMTEVASPDVLAGNAWSYNEGRAGYLVSWMADHLIQTATWPDPGLVRVARMPVPPDGAGGILFWCTGALLPTYGQHKAEAAAYMDALTHDEDVYRFAITGEPDGVASRTGQLPVYSSTWEQYADAPPAWLADAPWVAGVRDWLEDAESIHPTKIGFDQFFLPNEKIVAYLKGEETDARAALQEYKNQVDELMKAT
jgi:ABC-type glycerol-3-phosphate transport system substrate-binding protein